MLDCRSSARGFKSPPEISDPSAPSYKEYTGGIHVRWENETVRESSGHPPSYAEAKKIESLTLHTDGSLRTSLTALIPPPPSPPLPSLPPPFFPLLSYFPSPCRLTHMDVLPSHTYSAIPQPTLLWQTHPPHHLTVF